MTESKREKTTGLSAASIGWGAIVLVCVGLAVYSVPAFLRLRKQQAALKVLQVKDAEDAKRFDQLLGWNAASDAAAAQAAKDRNVVLSMYRACRSPVDFFVVYPGQLAAVSGHRTDGLRLLLYVPEGKFRLEADITAEGSGGAGDSEGLVDLEPIHREFELTGPKAHQFDLQFDEQDKTRSVLRCVLDGSEKVAVDVGPYKKVGSVRRGNANLLGPPYVLTNDAIVARRRNLVDYGIRISPREGAKKSTRIRFRLTLAPDSSNPVRLPPTDRALLSRLTGPLRWAGPSRNLEYRDGWYYEKAPQGDSAAETPTGSSLQEQAP